MSSSEARLIFAWPSVMGCECCIDARLIFPSNFMVWACLTKLRSIRFCLSSRLSASSKPLALEQVLIVSLALDKDGRRACEASASVFSASCPSDIDARLRSGLLSQLVGINGSDALRYRAVAGRWSCLTCGEEEVVGTGGGGAGSDHF